MEEYTACGIKDFKVYALKAFESTERDYSIQIAGSRFNNAELKVRRGRMVLSGWVGSRI